MVAYFPQPAALKHEVSMQGDCLIELPVDFKVPETWAKICATKKANRFRPAEVADAMAEKEQAAERLQVRPC